MDVHVADADIFLHFFLMMDGLDEDALVFRLCEAEHMAGARM